MTLNLSMPGTTETDLKPRITVFGVGGAGGNAVDNMIAKALDGVEFVVANTDAQALAQSSAPHRVQLGVKVTEGLGAGARAAVGAAAAEESIEEIVNCLAGAHMCFITAGMGGGTGTGAAPIIAQAARELGVLTVGVVTKPFQFEGLKRMRQAEEGVENLQKVVDTLIIIPNQNLFRLANEKTTFTEAFSMADDVLYQGVKGVTDLMVRPGLINLDFADVRAVMDEMGKAMMGTGEAEGEDRAIQAAEKAIANPLLDEISLRGAKGVLINITGGTDLTLFELDEAANRIRDEVDADANIIVGSTLDDSMAGVMRVSVVATGIDATEKAEDMPVPRRRMSEPLRERSVAEAEPADQPEPVQPQADRPAAAYEPAGYEGQRHGYNAPQPARAEAEPSLFPEFAPAEPEQRIRAELHDEDLPGPAYPPAPQSDFRPGIDAMDARPEEFHMEALRPSGAPSPDKLDRLRDATQRAAHHQAAPAPAPAPAPAAPQPAPVQQAPRGQRGFGMSSLIERMTGHGADAQQSRRQPPRMQAEKPQPYPDVEPDPDQDRIDIPAFLRRQAN